MPLPTRVGEVMTARVTTIAPEATVADAILLFGDCTFRHLLVATEHGELAGVLSDRDVLRHLARGRDPRASRVADIMKTEPVVVTVDTPVTDAIDLLSFHRINCLPVIDGSQHVRGIVTTTDLLKTLYRVLVFPAVAAT